MDDISPLGDWAEAIQDDFLKEAGRLKAAGTLTENEAAVLDHVIALPSAHVDRLLISPEGGSAAELVGHFVVTQAGDPALKQFLYSPVTGLKPYASAAALHDALQQCVADPVSRQDVLHFVPSEVRAGLASATILRVQRERIEAGVFAQCQQSIIALRAHQLELCSERLLGFPSLREALNALLFQQLEQEFQGLDLSPLTTWVNSYVSGLPGGPRLRVASMNLSDAALRYFANGWPDDQLREYLSPSVPYETTQAYSPTLDVRMLRVVREATRLLPALIKTWVEDFWSLSIDGMSLRELADQIADDCFFNALLQARHIRVIDNSLFSQLKAFCGPVQAGRPWQAVQLSLLDLGNAEVELAGMFTAYLPANGADVFLFSEHAGLERFGSRASLRQTVLNRLKAPSATNSLLLHLSRDQQVQLRKMHNLILQVSVISDALFANRVQSIINKQQRDLTFLLDAAKGSDYDVNALVDHALDVRRLLDPRLQRLHTEGRWSTSLALQREAIPMPGLLLDKPAPDTLLDKLQRLKKQSQSLCEARPELQTFARQRLDTELKVSQGHLSAETLKVQSLSSEAAPSTPRPLTDILLEQVTGFDPLPDDGVSIQLGVQQDGQAFSPVAALQGADLISLLGRASTGFIDGFVEQLRDFYSADNRTLPGLSMTRAISLLWGTALRYEMAVKDYCCKLGPVQRQMLNTVLDRPLRSERHSLLGFVPDVCELSLMHERSARTLSLSNCFVITERGGTDPDNSGQALLWMAPKGLEIFASLDACLGALSTRLLDKLARQSVLDCVFDNERLLVTDEMQFVASVIETHWLETCQSRVFTKQVEDVEFILRQAVASGDSAQSLINQVACYWAELPDFTIDELIETISDWQFNERLPDWLKYASSEDRKEYADLLLRFRWAGGDADSYLHGVPELLDYAREQLGARLAVDFPEASLNPDQIEITLVEYSGPASGEIAGIPAVSRLSHALTYFALSNFINVQSGLRSYRSLGPQPLPAGLNDHYVRQLVRSLDLAARYVQLLEEKLTPGNAGVSQRQARFSLQLPAQVLEQAFQAKLKNTLSDTAYAYLKQVMNSPDAKARQPLNEVELVVRPLAFRAIEGRHADVAQGMYLIGPANLNAGPQLLYVFYNKEYALKEYRDQNALISELHTSASLQALVLGRLEPRVRKIYDHNGFVEPHIGYVDPTLMSALEANPPATLVPDPITGNLFVRLYADMLHVRLAQAKAQSSSVAQADWASLKYVLSLLADIALLVLPGKLSLPLFVWQGEASVQASVQALDEGHWGEALFQFVNGLLMIEAGRASLTPRVRSGSTEPVPSEPAAVTPVKSIGKQLTPEQSNALRVYAANDVSLVDLREDLASGLYTDIRTSYQYISMAAEVFRVVDWRGRWRIYIGEGRYGPLVKRDAQQHWQWDPSEPLLGGGQVLGIQPAQPGAEFFADGSKLQACGMRNIERLYPERALIIREAHEQAISYLKACKAHLRPVKEVSELGADARQLLERIFSAKPVDKTVLKNLKGKVNKILSLMQSSSFSPVNSTRYYLYTSPDTQTVARTTKVGSIGSHDAVFFGDGFFASADEVFEFSVKGRDGKEFDRVKHATATILIHEFSHMALDTIDLNYLGVKFPFEELLIPETTGYAPIRKRKGEMQDHRYLQLTTEVAPGDLFREKHVGARSYMAWSYKAPMAAAIRTGCKTPEELRNRFYQEPLFRAEIVMMNADSMALLISWLGYFKP